jgi:hypothetical protein
MRMFTLIIASVIFLSCAHKEMQPPKFNGRWQFIEAKPGETMACLSREDVQKLREELIRCRASKAAK